MSGNLVIYENNSYNKVNLYQRFDKIFIENNHKEIIGENEKFIKVEQFYNAIEIKKSDFFVSKNINKIFKKIYKTKVLNKDEDLANAHNTFKQKVALYACDIQRSFTFTRLIKKKFKLKGKIYIEANIFNYKVYKIMKKLKLLDKDIDFTLENKILSFLIYYIKNIYFFVKALLIIEKKLFKTKFFTKNNLSKKEKLISIFVKDLTFDEKNINLSFLEKNKKLKKKIIYVSDEKDIIKTGNHYNKKIVNLENDILKKLNFFFFIKKFYFKFTIKKVRFLLLGIKNPVFLNVIFKSLNNIINWELFYLIYKTKFHLNAMSDEKIFIKNTHNVNNVKTIFLYFSTTEELIQISNNNGFTRVNYVYLNYDYLVADRVSINLFKSQKVKVDNFIKIGNIGSDIILKNLSIKKVNFNKKKIKLSNKSKVISVFDHSIGRDGVWNQSDYKKLLNNIYILIKKYKFQVIYKSKKSFKELNENFSTENKVLFDKILKNKKFKYFAGSNKILSSFEIISLSDLVITAPVSSIISETMCATKKVLVYDPNGNYKSKRFFIRKIEEFYCNDEDSFIFKVFKIIKMKKSLYIKKIYSNFIHKELRLKKFGSNLQSLEKTLENEL